MRKTYGALKMRREPLERAATWVRGFVAKFLRVPLACLGSREAAEQLGNSHKTFYKPSSPSNGPS